MIIAILVILGYLLGYFLFDLVLVYLYKKDRKNGKLDEKDERELFNRRDSIITKSIFWPITLVVYLVIVFPITLLYNINEWLLNKPEVEKK